MLPDISLFRTEIGLSVLAVAGLLLDLFLPRRTDRGRFLADTATGGLLILLVDLVFSWGSFGTALGGSFVRDGYAVFFKGIFLLTGIFVLHMARDYEDNLKRGQGEFVILILFGLIGMSFLVSANEFLLFFVSLETLTVSLYIITAYLRDDERSIEAGMKFVILGALSTALMVYGLSFIYGATGSTSFIAIQKALAASSTLPPAFVFGVALVITSLGFKMAAFPFQFWVPDVYEGAPTPITAFLAIGSKAASFGAMVRLLMTVFMPVQELLITVFAVLSAATILYGNLGAIPQKNIKRLLAYSSIGHAGYLLMGLAAFGHMGKEAVVFYLASYLFSTAAAFLVVVWVSDRTKAETISDFAGLAKKSPLLAASMLIALSSLAGVPPLAGFIAKYYLLAAAVKSGLLWLAAIGLVNVVVSLYYYLGVVKVMYVDKPADASEFNVPALQKIFQYASMAGIIILGVFPGPFIRLVDSAFLNFLRF